jgi:hypothetical protein
MPQRVFCRLIVSVFWCASSSAPAADRSYVVERYPILEAIEASGVRLAGETRNWMAKWKGMSLENSPAYQFKELSGSTSINGKIQRLAPDDPKGFTPLGAFVPRNASANPNTEIAYFNIAAIIGHDKFFRPAVPYELGPKGRAAFKALILITPIKGQARLKNRRRILEAIETGRDLQGCIKAKKADSERTYDEIVRSRAPNGKHPIIAYLQASNPKPTSGSVVTLASGYNGDALELAREFPSS